MFSEKEASDIMFQIMSAVSYCHQKKVIHRDLKPENIFLDEKNGSLSIKIGDFGSSCILNPKRKVIGCFGSAYYIAPEVLSGSYDEKCDVWSCGIILYILLTGQPPYKGRDNPSILAEIKDSPLIITQEMLPNVSPAVVDLLKKLLVQSPASRISASESLSHP